MPCPISTRLCHNAGLRRSRQRPAPVHSAVAAAACGRATSVADPSRAGMRPAIRQPFQSASTMQIAGVLLSHAANMTAMRAPVARAARRSGGCPSAGSSSQASRRMSATRRRPGVASPRQRPGCVRRRCLQPAAVGPQGAAQQPQAGQRVQARHRFACSSGAGHEAQRERAHHQHAPRDEERPEAHGAGIAARSATWRRRDARARPIGNRAFSSIAPPRC